MSGWFGRTAASVLVVATSFACGCGGDTAVQLRAGERADVEVGDVLVISVWSEHGIGDDWQIVGDPAADVVRFVDTDYEEDQPGADGGGGTETFTFEAVGVGSTAVVLHNCFRCDDEGNTPPEWADEAEDLRYEIAVR